MGSKAPTPPPKKPDKPKTPPPPPPAWRYRRSFIAPGIGIIMPDLDIVSDDESFRNTMAREAQDSD